MASLAVDGEPNAWLDIGYAISTLATLLEAELSDADVLGAQALARSWYGPTATAFSVDWASRRGRYEELIDLARRASRLITEYGEALHEAQEHSRAIEYLGSPPAWSSRPAVSLSSRRRWRCCRHQRG